jgi:hypothetical protein
VRIREWNEKRKEIGVWGRGEGEGRDEMANGKRQRAKVKANGKGKSKWKTVVGKGKSKGRGRGKGKAKSKGKGNGKSKAGERGEMAVVMTENVGWGMEGERRRRQRIPLKCAEQGTQVDPSVSVEYECGRSHSFLPKRRMQKWMRCAE